MTTVVYAVEGMSCDHCAHAITDEVLKIADVEQVNVDLTANTVTVSGQPVDDAAVRAAIDEAGYTVVG